MTIYQVEHHWWYHGDDGWEQLTDPIDTFANLKDAEAFINKFQIPEGYSEKYRRDPDEVGTLVITPIEVKEHFNPEEYDCVVYDFFWLDSYRERTMKEMEEEASLADS